MRLTVILETADDAAIENPVWEAARALHIIKAAIEEFGPLNSISERPIRDTNGNTMGNFSFDPQHGEQADD